MFDKFFRRAPQAEPDGGTAITAETRGAYDVDEHHLSPEQVAERFSVQVNWTNITNSPGLTTAQAQERLAQYGKNQLTPPKEVSEIVKFIKQFLNPLMLLLVVAGGLCFMAYGIQSPKDKNNLILGAALLITVTFTCVMSYVQERSASNVMASLSKMMPNQCTVIRDGKEAKVNAADLVPGDLVRLYIGDRIPADIRIIETADLKVECSSLTGESDLVPASVDKKHDLPAEARNLLFMSSLCMNGEGRGIVIRTGDNTMIGKIATLAAGTTNQRSTLQVEVHRLVIFVACIAFISALALFIVGLARKTPAVDAFVNGFILVLVAYVPEGLPATVTSCLALTAMRLKEKNVLIKRTDIIENLGCATIIASDKTGTLTQNKMSAENVWCNSELHNGAAFVPPPLPRDPSIGRQSRLARMSRSIAARSRDLIRTSRPLESISVALDTVSKSLGRMSRPALGKDSKPILNTTSKGNAALAAAPATIAEHDQQKSNKPLTATSVHSHLAQPVSFVAPMRMKPLSTTSAPFVSDHAKNMSIGRKSVLLGDGRMDIEEVPLHRDSTKSNKSSTPSQAPMSPLDQMKMQQFPNSSAVNWSGSTAITKLVTCATVCNKAKFSGTEAPPTAGTINEDDHVGVIIELPTFRHGADDRKVLGDATDAGLLRYCDRLIPAHVLRLAYNKVFDIPFNSANKWALVVTECPGNLNDHVVMMKGAPEIIVTKCSHHLKNGKEVPIDDNFRAEMMAAYEHCGMMGERVLGFAYKTIPARLPETYKTEEGGPPTEGLVFCGLISLVDPPREGVAEAVAKCRNAGIRVAMVTGDHPLTAEAIARKVGIVTLRTRREVAAERGVAEADVDIADEEVQALVITGQQLRQIESEEEWDTILMKDELVFARTSPQQKLQIVEHLQRLGEIVAVTGDGVNDSPALKKAQIGVAMGLGGSDVAREAADIVLLDDQFPSIVNAIEEGRVIYDNLKKTIAYTLTHTIPEVLPLFLNLAFSFPLGLGGLLILSIDLVTEQGPAISLAYEPAESSVMDRQPRDLTKDRLISGPLLRYSYLIMGVTQGAVCLIAYFTIFWWYGVPLSSVIWAVDKDHFMTSTDSNETLYIDCTMNPDGTEVCKHVFGPDKQTSIYRNAQSAWYITLVLCQFWHIWLCKTRQASILTHGLHRNLVTWIGAAVSIGTILIIVYAPFLQGIFLTTDLIGIGWVPQLLFLVIMLPYTEMSKLVTRRNPDSWWARHMQW